MVQLNHMEPRFVEKYVDSGSCTIAYQQGGTPNHKPPLLLIHGWAIGVKPDQEVLTHLAQHYCVIVPDLSGFARSKYTRSLTTYYSYAELLLDFTKAISVDTVHLVRHSFWEGIAIEMAALAPDRVRSLVLVDSTGIPGKSLLGVVLHRTIQMPA